MITTRALSCLPYQQHQFQVRVCLPKLVILYAVDVLGLHQVTLMNLYSCHTTIQTTDHS